MSVEGEIVLVSVPIAVDIAQNLQIAIVLDVAAVLVHRESSAHADESVHCIGMFRHQVCENFHFKFMNLRMAKCTKRADFNYLK